MKSVNLMFLDYLKPAYRFLFSFPFIFLSVSGGAQSLEKPDSTTTTYRQIFFLLDQEKYEQSLVLIREAFETNFGSVPDALVFCFGKALMGTGEYVRARSAFSEYLKGGDSTYRVQTERYLERLKTKICQKCDNTGYHEVTRACGKCDGAGGTFRDCVACSKVGSFACSVCGGRGVLIKNGSMGKIFKECAECGGKGVSGCGKCHGAKKIKTDCDICHGRGEVASRQICTH